jgi:hypothetical protein
MSNECYFNFDPFYGSCEYNNKPNFSLGVFKKQDWEVQEKFLGGRCYLVRDYRKRCLPYVMGLYVL